MKHIFLRIHAPLNVKYTIDKKECISFGNAYINRLVNIEHESSTDTDIDNVSKKRSIFLRVLNFTKYQVTKRDFY